MVPSTSGQGDATIYSIEQKNTTKGLILKLHNKSSTLKNVCFFMIVNDLDGFLISCSSNNLSISVSRNTRNIKEEIRKRKENVLFNCIRFSKMVLYHPHLSKIIFVRKNILGSLGIHIPCVPNCGIGHNMAATKFRVFKLDIRLQEKINVRAKIKFKKLSTPFQIDEIGNILRTRIQYTERRGSVKLLKFYFNSVGIYSTINDPLI
jgi:hypothetical protein